MAEPQIIGTPQPVRSSFIKGLFPSMPERGKIKIGQKGAMSTSRRGTEFQPPQKLDHFVITTMERGPDDNFLRDEEIHARLGDAPVSIPIRFLYDDPAVNFPTRYACYVGRTLWCSGDGERATRIGKNGEPGPVQCPCPRKEPTYKGTDKCKMNGVLQVLIDGAGGLGGVWKFRTTSYNSIVGIMSSLAYLRSLTGGVLANIPFSLTVRPKRAQAPDGTAVLVYVVGVEFAGDIAALQSRAHEIALARATTNVRIADIEDEARRLLLAPPNAPLPGDDDKDIVEEFYPEQAVADLQPPSVAADLDLFADAAPEPAADQLDEFLRVAEIKADAGLPAFRAWWKTLSAANKDLLEPHLGQLMDRAKEVSAHQASSQSDDVPLPGEDLGPMTVGEMG